MPLVGLRLDQTRRARLRHDFLAAYQQLFHYTTGDPVEIANLRVIGRGVRAGHLDLTRQGIPHESNPACGARAVLFDRAVGPVTATVLERSALAAGRHEGPLLVDSLDTTIAVPPGAALTVAAGGNLLMELPG